jgi:hypothetical protein
MRSAVTAGQNGAIPHPETTITATISKIGTSGWILFRTRITLQRYPLPYWSGVLGLLAYSPFDQIENAGIGGEQAFGDPDRVPGRDQAVAFEKDPLLIVGVAIAFDPVQLLVEIEKPELIGFAFST